MLKCPRCGEPYHGFPCMARKIELRETGPAATQVDTVGTGIVSPVSLEARSSGVWGNENVPPSACPRCHEIAFRKPVFHLLDHQTLVGLMSHCSSGCSLISVGDVL